jgi:predicted transcriptional regulator
MKQKARYSEEDFTSKVKNLTQVKVFRAILNSCDPVTMQWTHSKEVRLDISSRLKISEVTFKRALQGIVKSGLVNKLSRGNYQVNKKYS